jgi:hypothetical protein
VPIGAAQVKSAHVALAVQQLVTPASVPIALVFFAESTKKPVAHVTAFPPQSVTSFSQQFMHVVAVAELLVQFLLTREALNLYPAAQLPAMAPKGHTTSKATIILEAIVRCF